MDKKSKMILHIFLKLRLRPFETQHPEIWVKIHEKNDTLFSNKIFIYFFRWLCRNPDLVSLRCCQVKHIFIPNLLHIFVTCMIISWASWACPSIFFLPCCFVVLLSSFVTPIENFFTVLTIPSFFGWFLNIFHKRLLKGHVGKLCSIHIQLTFCHDT